jgi:sulfatase maturation enzyme AslB (radical SAM superfamily)
VTQPERLSIEVTRQCAKACWFCYSGSAPSGETRWTAGELFSFVSDCAAHGSKAVSFGGGEPLEFPSLFEVLVRLRGVLFRSVTSNGLLLEGEVLERLVEARPEKVHLSIHFPSDAARVIEQVQELQARGVRSGVNLLVARSQLAQARQVAERVRDAGIGNERIVYLPMRKQDTPSPEELAQVAGGVRFQSMTCLSRCEQSPRFASIAWDKTAAWCSYTAARRPLTALTNRGLLQALDGLGLTFCGGGDGRELVRLSGSPLDGHGLVRGRP